MTIARSVRSKWRCRHRARHIRLHERANPHLGQVTHLTERAILALQYEIADRHAARIQLHDQRRQHVGRHACLRPVGLTYDRRHRLGHVGVRIERKLDERNLADASRFDVLDAVDVLERQFELVD